MKKLYMSKDAKKAIEKAMSKTERRALKNGATFCAILRVNQIRPLARWGWDDNLCFVSFKKNGEIIRNSLINLTENYWKNREESAARAIDYFVVGEKNRDYDVFIIPVLEDDAFLSPEKAQQLELPVGTKYLLKAGSPFVEYNDGKGTWWQEELIRKWTRHCGEDQGCYWTPWVDRYGHPVEFC